MSGTVYWYDALFKAIFSSSVGSGDEEYDSYTTLVRNIRSELDNWESFDLIKNVNSFHL